MKYEDSSDYDKGWTDATASVMEIWDQIVQKAAGRTEAFEMFQSFMDLCAVRLSGASDQDVRDIVRLRDGN